MKAVTTLHMRLSSEQRGKRYSYFQVTIPARLVRELGWEAGAPLEMEIKEMDGKRGIFIRRLA